jgi:hypothetical protein
MGSIIHGLGVFVFASALVLALAGDARAQLRSHVACTRSADGLMGR